MIGWIDDLPVGWMAVVIFAAVFLATAALYLVVMAAAVGAHERARARADRGSRQPGVAGDGAAARDAHRRLGPACVRPLNLALHLETRTPGQVAAQRELVSLLDGAFDARRQRIIVSSATVNWVKWASILALAGLTLVSIAFVHSGNPRTAAIAMGLFGSAVAVAIVMIATQDRPFSGQFGVKPDVLLRVLPPTR